MTTHADDATLQSLIETLRGAPGEQLGSVDALLARFPDDARLHFLRGSILAGDRRYIEAHGALKRAVELAPDYAIARFQLGFFQLTSGETASALDTWGRLDGLSDGHYLRKFVDGLRCLIRDDFEGVIAHLSEGIALNGENAPLNQDMDLLLEQVRPLAAAARDGEPQSETAFVLQHFTQRRPN